MAGVTRARAHFPHSFEKQRKAQLRKRKVRGKRSSLFLCKRGLGECSQTKRAQTRVEGCPTLTGCVCAQGALSSDTRQKPVFSMAPPPPHQDPGSRAQWGCPTSSFSFLALGPSASKVLGGGLVMQGLPGKTFCRPTRWPGASHSHTKERTEYIFEQDTEGKGSGRDPAVKGFRIKTAGTYAHARPPSQAILSLTGLKGSCISPVSWTQRL